MASLLQFETAVTEAQLALAGRSWSAFRSSSPAQWRTLLEQDGVMGASMVFRADVPPGDWWLTAWVEAGMEDSSTVAIAINGHRVDPAWHPFRPPAEPRQQIQKIYRVVHRRVEVDSTGLKFTLEGGQEAVRLLGLTLTPVSDVSSTPPTGGKYRLARAAP